GMVQANVVILPRDWAAEFLLYCQRNPKPCPVLAVGAPGDPGLPDLGPDIDIRTDVPRYRAFRDGEAVGAPANIRHLWRAAAETLALGGSYSCEEALREAGLPLRHHEQGVKVPIYLTELETVPAGAFAGPLIVSMRPFVPADAIRAIQITSRFPDVHGAPVHFGDPAMIGIADISRPWSG